MNRGNQPADGQNDQPVDGNAGALARLRGQFGGSPHEDARQHICAFLEVCDSFRQQGVHGDVLKLKLFPYSLRDRARAWLSGVPVGSMESWADLCRSFLMRYNPPNMHTQLKNDIASFRQADDESMYECWDRYKGLLRKYASANETLLDKSPEEAFDILDRIANNDYQFPTARLGAGRRAPGKLDLDASDSVSAQLSAITNMLKNLQKPTDVRDAKALSCVHCEGNHLLMIALPCMTPIVVPPDWTSPFELICDASDYAVGAALGQHRGKLFHVMYYASRTLNDAQVNYTTTEKELLAVVLAFDKFMTYLIDCESNVEIKENFHDEKILSATTIPWYSDIVNFLVSGVLPHELSSQGRKNFRHDARYYFWDEPYLFKQCADQLLRRCVPKEEQKDILFHCHTSTCGGHFGGARTAAKHYVSKWVEAIATPRNDAQTVLKFLHKYIFTRFEVPRAIISDEGTHFYNKLIAKAAQRYGIRHKIATAYHPQTNGQAEVSNREINKS
ncbi:hypothetical protein GQ457_18G005370 [Hibiscus cannabinus]